MSQTISINALSDSLQRLVDESGAIAEDDVEAIDQTLIDTVLSGV